MEDKAIIEAVTQSLKNRTTKITDSHLNRYDQLRNQLQQVDVGDDARFQSTFSGLFQLRWMPRQHRFIYFAMMQQQKMILPGHSPGHSFRDLLEAYHAKTGRWEVSFISKMIAIIDPNRSIWDNLVSTRLDIRLPVVRNLEICAVRYEALENRMKGLIENKNFTCVVDAFGKRFPDRDYTNMRILDATIWGLG